MTCLAHRRLLRESKEETNKIRWQALAGGGMGSGSSGRGVGGHGNGQDAI